MKPTVEKISHKPDFGWRIQYYYGGDSRFDWHYHFEYELVLYRHCVGKKFVGDYIGPIEHNTLSLFAPKLPHTGILDNCLENEHNETYIIWFSHAWVTQLIACLPELKNLQQVLNNASQGLDFPPSCAEKVYSLLAGQEKMSPALAVSHVIEVLVHLSECRDIKRLNSYAQHSGSAYSEASQNREEAGKALKLVEQISHYIDKHYREDIKLADLCKQVHVSKSTVARIFERHFLNSFSVHLAEYRLGKACEYLLNSDKSIASIADLVGFNNLSNFNRQFKAKKQISPKQFRQLFSQ